MANDIQGNVTGKVRFTIDKKSWDNLDLFQKKLTSVKKQLNSLDKSFTLNATVNQVVQAQNKITNNRVANIKREVSAKKAAAKEGYGIEFGRAKGNDRSYASWWADALRQQDAERRQAAREARKVGAGSVASGKLMSDDRFQRETDNYISGKRSQIEKQLRLAGYDKQKIADIQASITKQAGDLFKLHSGNNDLNTFKRSLSNFYNTLSTGERIVSKSRITMASLRGEIVQLTAAYSAFQGVAMVAQTGMNMQGIEAAANVFTGGDAKTREHLAWIANMSDRIGSNFMTAAKEYNSFAIAVGSKMSTSQQRNLFEGVTEYAKVLQISDTDYQRALRAINQMASKNQIYKEELTGR